MDNYKNLFYKSQAEIANAIQNLEDILDNLKRCMQECEEQAISDNRKEIQISSESLRL